MRSRLSSMGEKVYDSNKEILERKYLGKVVALCERGVAGIGDSLEEAYRKAKKKHPKEVFYFRRVGPCPEVGHLFLLL